MTYPTLQTFLADAPTQFVLLYGATGPGITELGYRSTEAAWYVQDEIKLRPNLTLRLGLRDEMTSGWTEVTGRCSNSTWDSNGILSSQPLIGHNCLSQNNAIALWQPRVGIAWDPTGTGTWAVRAGGGFYNDLQDNLAFRFNNNQPFNERVTYTGVPLLSLTPVAAGTLAPPQCSPTLLTGCVVIAPGGIEPTMHSPTIQQ